jgi:hypothetical protein
MSHGSASPHYASLLNTTMDMPLGFIGMEVHMRHQSDLASLVSNNMNLVHKYSSTQTVEDALLDIEAAEIAGIMVLQNMPSAKIAFAITDFWESHIRGLVNEQQIGMWYIPEEPITGSVPRLKEIAQIIHRLDLAYKRHVCVYIYNSIPSYLRDFSDRSIETISFGGVYINTFTTRPRADIKRRMEAAMTEIRTPVLAMLEAFKYRGTNVWTRSDTIRFDAYLSLICGCKGLLWYTYYWTVQNEELLAAIFAVCEELNGSLRLGDAILFGASNSSVVGTITAGQATAPPASAYEYSDSSYYRVTYPSLQYLVRVWEGQTYIFAVNMAQLVGAEDDGGEAYGITVTFSGLTGTSVEVVNESRTIAISGGSFSDTFIPLGVHIYKI